MFFRKLVTCLALGACLPLLLTTCGGASFADPSKIAGLRVLAVQKSAPYPKPGDLVNLKLLFWDGKSTEENPRNIFVFMSPIPCENPPGDLYYNCLTELARPRDGGADGEVPDGGEPDGDVPEGGAPRSAPGLAGFVPISAAEHAPFRRIDSSSFALATRPEPGPALQDINHVRQTTVRIDPNIIIKRAPGVPEYGLAYVLFIACAGIPMPVPDAGPNKLPFGCFDAEGRELGADDFVLGYTSMYVFADRVNNNPVIDDFVFDGASLAGSTTDETLVRHIPSCKESDRTKCPNYLLKPSVNREATDEVDDAPDAVTPDGKRLREQAWVNYYITAGDLKSSVRLVNDATTGWNDKHETEYSAPAEPGPVRLFAVVHDNRGGVAWVEGKIIVD
jgi:hypothetical protein